MVEVAKYHIKVGLAWIAVRSNLLVTCLVDVVLQLFKLGHRMALMGFVLTIGLLQGEHGVCHDDRVFASPLHPEVQQRPCPDLWHGGGGGVGGGRGVEPIPSGGGNTKAELPDLPALESPLQFGDWIHLCGPVMRDLSPGRKLLVGPYNTPSWSSPLRGGWE